MASMISSMDRPGPKRKKKVTSKGELMPDSKEKSKQSHIQRGINARFQRKEELMPDSKEKKSHQRKEALLPDT